MKKLFCISLIMLLQACNMLAGADIRPLNPPSLPAAPEGGPPEFQQGWQDGCDTGFAQHGSDVYRSSYSFKQDPSKVLNPVYYQAWKDAENFCRTYIFEYSVRSFDVYCSFDGLNEDCGDTSNKSSVPFLGGSSDSIGYNVIGGGGIGSVMGGGTDGFLGNTSGVGSVFGDW